MKENSSPARKTALIGVLAAAAIAASLLERAFCAALPLPPGVRPGFSNVVVLFACSALGLPYALGITVLKAGAALLTAGPTAGVLSLAGGVCSVCGAAVLLRFGKKLSYAGVSVVGATLHNAAQLITVSLLTGTGAYWTLAPVLLLAGVGFGLFTGMILNAVMPALLRLFPFIKKGR